MTTTIVRRFTDRRKAIAMRDKAIKMGYSSLVYNRLCKPCCRIYCAAGIKEEDEKLFLDGHKNFAEKP